MPVEFDGIEFLTAGEAAERLGVKRETLYAYASRGRVRSFRRGMGRARYYRRDEIDALTRVAAEAPPTHLGRVDDWMDGHA